jgi:type I restriction enzyme, S subunit
MNAERLMACYDKVADSPEAIPRFRRFILELAVRGKLVPQDPNDKPASDLLDRMLLAKSRQFSGRQRTSKKSPPISAAEIPTRTPSSWVWARLCDIGRIGGGMTPSMSRSEYWDGNIVWLSPKDIKSDELSDSELRISSRGLDETSLELYPPGCIFIVARSGILKRQFPVAINRVPAAANQDLKVLVPFLEGQERYLQIMFRGLMAFLLKNLVKTGTTVQSLKYDEFEQQPFPLPPLAEQYRIVAKVDELMGLCDRLEGRRRQREQNRSRLTTSSFARLELPNPEAFQHDARFVIDALPILASRTSQIESLRRAILNLAMRGRLVLQDSNEAPASELIAKMATEIVDYCSTNRISRAEVKRLEETELPSPAPRGWCWVRLCDMFKVITDGDHQPPPKADQGVAFLTIGNITTGRLDFTDCRRVSEEYYGSLPAYRTPAKGDILYTVVGATYGRPALVETDRNFCVQRHIAILKPCESLDVRFLMLLLASPLVYDQASKSTTGTAQPTIPLRPLRNFVVPLPPRGEQGRIVAKVVQLMAICDQLERSVTAADQKRSRLLNSLLAEALQDSSDAIAA